MPPRVDPRDWDRLFRPGAPKRGGPLRALINLVIVGAIFSLLGGGAIFAFSFGIETTRMNNAATATAAVTATARAVAAATASVANTATAAALALATPTPDPTPTLEAIGMGSVTNGGNLRSEPVVAPETVIGQICPGDQFAFLEERLFGADVRWYRIAILVTAEDCTPERVPVGTEGWASGLLLTPP
ncbi:MAG: SH3 domain-containing protein [Candidatus Viridilinea halotolerans]|uniref:SH3 domain-containing protein n=1 Tax=Candidatus Viridilinea halotolerans TaxID=2491704 RepID=A0A426TZH7_9CHLR|nr:MAG: SH3 domain-containing protein [Candidatus Viridilinea halotolerans]